MIQVAESSKPKKGPKTVDHLELHPKMGGGHIVKHVYSGYEHDPKEVKFNGEGKSQGGEHVIAHLMKHGGLPAMTEAGGEGKEECAGEEEMA